MKLYLLTDKHSKDSILNSISLAQNKVTSENEVNYILDMDFNHIGFVNYLLIIENDCEDYLQIASAGVKSDLFGQIVICDKKTTAESFINQINKAPILCTVDFKMGSAMDVFEDIKPLYLKIKLKYPDTVVIGYTNLEDPSRAEIGDQPRKLIELFRLNRDSVYDKFEMSDVTLSNIFRDKLDISNLYRQVNELKKKVENLIGTGEIIGKSNAIQKILSTISQIAKTEARVFITGENGTGKELVAKAIHKGSKRCTQPFISVNCAAIPEDLIESELFGHEKGAFTGAIISRIGKIELANNGTLFLDEIGDMSLKAQAKVLRVLENGILERVGGIDSITVDVRVIAATNKNISEEITKGNFREDLFYRLNVILINIPPLRERTDDIPMLVDYLLEDMCNKNKYPLKIFSKSAITALQALRWEGNIRELKNFIERIVILTPEVEITEKDIYALLPRDNSKLDDILNGFNSFNDFKDKMEKAFIKKQLEANNWNINKTAKALFIQIRQLQSYISKYNLVEIQESGTALTQYKINDNECSESERFLDKIESILIDHFKDDAEVTQYMIATKFISPKRGNNKIARGTFNKEWMKHRLLVEQLFNDNPGKWPTIRTKCPFIKKIIFSKEK